MVLHEGKPYIIEIAARLSGGYFCSHEIPLNTGVDFVRQSINIALGREIDEDSLSLDLTFQYLNDTFSPRQDV